jgi:SAM-dependent methyltransferase
MQPGSTPIKYIHEDDTHNLQSPGIIVPYLVDKFKPDSVIDIGCGIGTFLHVFKNHGVKNVLGVDGKWVNRKQLYINEEEFLEANLEEPIRLNKIYDLVISLEVAEHLSPSSADVFVDSLTSLGKIIVFSAATGKQGGQNHLNEQPFAYWKEKFRAKGYSAIDFFRPFFWNDERIQWWYKQNMFLVVHNSINAKEFEASKPLFSDNNLLIHPDLYYERIREYEQKDMAWQKLGAGEGGNFNLYLKLLYRSFRKTFSR